MNFVEQARAMLNEDVRKRLDGIKLEIEKPLKGSSDTSESER